MTPRISATNALFAANDIMEKLFPHVRYQERRATIEVELNENTSIARFTLENVAVSVHVWAGGGSRSIQVTLAGHIWAHTSSKDENLNEIPEVDPCLVEKIAINHYVREYAKQIGFAEPGSNDILFGGDASRQWGRFVYGKTSIDVHRLRHEPEWTVEAFIAFWDDRTYESHMWRDIWLEGEPAPEIPDIYRPKIGSRWVS